MTKIGIGITTHNRYSVFKTTYQNILKFLPPNAKLVIIDDASKKHVPEATFRFDKNVGIATAKNKCFELLEGCDHIFLFDDDCYPITNNWWVPYIENAEPHLMYIFENTSISRHVDGCIEVYRDKTKVAYSHPRGCMLYYDKICLEKVGGMDTSYAKWGFEHVDLTNRIYNVGLTTWRYMDVVASHELFYSLDEEFKVARTTSMAERERYAEAKRDYYMTSFTRTTFCDIKVLDTKPIPNSSQIILTCYLTGKIDPERKVLWTADKKALGPLIKSCKGNRLVILTDCFDEEDNGELAYLKIETQVNPYIQRWISYYYYLMAHKEVKEVWLVDGTDVELLKYPFNHLCDDFLYVGYEPSYVANEWMINRHSSNKDLSLFMREYGDRTLLNAGVVGGKREVVLRFLRQMLDFYANQRGNVGSADMGMLNYVCYHFWRDRLIYGKKITTEFKAEEKNNKVAIWKHK